MSTEEIKLVAEFNNASAFFDRLESFKKANGLDFDYKLYKTFGELSVKTDIAVEGPAMAQPKLDIGITKGGQFTVYGDYNKDGSKRDKQEFSKADDAAAFVINSAKRALKI